MSAKRTRLLFLLLFSFLLLATSGDAAAQESRASAELERYLASLGFSASDLRSAAQGDAVARLQPTQEGRDVAVVGVIGVRASRAAAVARAIDDPGLIAAGTSQFGVFGDPPSAADVRTVTFDRSEYRDLRGCHQGECAFKLSAAEMAAFAREVDWSSPNAKAQADDRLRAGLLRLVADYRRRGNAALPSYNDGDNEVHASDAFAAIAGQAREMAAFAPDVLRYLTTYPAAPPTGARNFVYWSESRIGRLRPTLTVNHVVAVVPASGTAILAKKQLYANHYLEGSLDMLAIVDVGIPAGGSAQAPNVYVILMRRFRFDNLPVGFFNVRGRVRSQLIDRTRADLTRARTAIEKPVASSGG